MSIIPAGSVVFEVRPKRFVAPTWPWTLPVIHTVTAYICPEQAEDHQLLLRIVMDNLKKSARTIFIAPPNGTMLPATTTP